MPRPARPTYPPSFWALIEQRAESTPSHVLLRDDRGRSLTAADYRSACERVAASLARSGVGSGTIVAWQLPTSLEAAVLMGALVRLDAVQCPVLPILRRAEVGFIAEQTGCSLLVVPKTWRGHDHAAMASEIASGTGTRVLVVDFEGRTGDALALPQADPDALPRAVAASDSTPGHGPGDTRGRGSDGASNLGAPPVRFIYYSSGTTSKPKGARHTDRSVMAGASAMLAHIGFEPDDVYPIAYPFTHIGAAAMLTCSLVTGMRLLLHEQFDPERTPLVMAEAGATLLGSAVPFFHAYLSAQRRHGSAPLFPRLRCCISGGAPKPPELHRELRRELGGVGIVSAWGLTEFPLATCASPEDPDALLAETEGRPGPEVELRVVGLDGRICAPGEEGELRLRGPQCCRGYVDSRLDAEAFDEAGYLRTGDLGVVLPSGDVRITGRLKDVIIRNAENISASEIEDALYAHPKVADVAVVGLPDARTGERACAVVALAPGVDALSLAELVEFGRARGLAIQKLPEQLELVDALPRNAMGKVLKQQLRETYRR
jgi:acyl-CoA synthetase (AMP-forming)/AMP-acid ligase II